MVKRPIVSEHFMSIAFDLVGPLPKGKGGKKYLHGTLEAMLTKAMNSGLDWVDQVPLALDAMGQCRSKSTGFSPAELVYGRKTLGPPDSLYCGWKEQRKELWNVSDWVEQLCDRLEVINYG